MAKRLRNTKRRKATKREADLRRYTDLPSTIHVLKYSELKLLDPSSWDDKNDSYYLSLYREKCGLKALLALCFTKSPETYHHWRIFAPGPAGVCIQFDAEALRTAVLKVAGARIEPVEYLTLDRLRSTQLRKDRLPFLKRFAFLPEQEVRAIWESSSQQLEALPIPVPIHRTLGKEVKELIRGDRRLRERRSVSFAAYRKRGVDGAWAEGDIDRPQELSGSPRGALGCLDISWYTTRVRSAEDMLLSGPLKVWGAAI